MNLLKILKKIYSCTMPQAASEGDMDSISPSDKTNDNASADDTEVEDMDSVSPSDKTNDTASADNAEVEGIQPVVLKRSKAEVIEGLSIPSLIGYSKLLPMLRNSYKKQKV